ncbi:hypothetical protein ABZ249_25315 [Nocardiopsis sp. NPDC006139]|uniref:hypothetical protein n=1 Tax=Nocardiopsis sp. NPDC006139 TaxID=3154578 RepID=UPI0033BDECC9
MSDIDLSHYQDSKNATTTVTMPDGTVYELKPIMQLGPEGDEVLLEVVEALSDFMGAAPADKGPRGPKGGKSKSPAKKTKATDQIMDMKAVIKLMGPLHKLLVAAAPTPKAAEQIGALPLMARFEIIMGYVQDQDLGGLFPSGS